MSVFMEYRVGHGAESELFSEVCILRSLRGEYIGSLS